jgi:hypothetical protein
MPNVRKTPKRKRPSPHLVKRAPIAMMFSLAVQPSQSRQMRGDTMLFMVIERFRDNDVVPVYKKLRDTGRMIPEGLKYIDSWVEPNFSRCFQLMECDDLRLFQEWVLQWRGSGATIEIVPVVPSAQTRDVVAPHLDKR